MWAWIKGGLSYSDGTMDDGAVAAMATVFAYLAIAAYSVHASEHHIFNMQEFGIGAGAIFAGVGVLFGTRKIN